MAKDFNNKIDRITREIIQKIKTHNERKITEDNEVKDNWFIKDMRE